MKRLIFSIFLAVALSGCAQKKIIARNCDKSLTGDLYICDPL